MPIKDNLSGYSIYNPLQKDKRKENPLVDSSRLFPAFPNAKFDIIYADPPWDYGGKVQFDKTLNKEINKEYKKPVFISSASFKYPTMPLAELISIPISDIAADNCILFMWTTNPHLEQAIKLGNSWGFKYKTVAFVWNKMVHNPGQYTMSYCELCLLFKKGKIPKRGARNVKQLVTAPRTAHSAKPLEVRNRIDKMFPDQEKIELFARANYDGWHSWGLEASNDEQLF